MICCIMCVLQSRVQSVCTILMVSCVLSSIHSVCFCVFVKTTDDKYVVLCQNNSEVECFHLTCYHICVCLKIML